jgi:hypothetical protein
MSIVDARSSDIDGQFDGVLHKRLRLVKSVYEATEEGYNRSYDGYLIKS